MSSLYSLLLFFFGASIGSFIGVLGARYSEEEGFSLAFKGRSKCAHCKKILRWYELLPLLSFFVQRGKCRSCKKSISRQTLIVEILAGLVLVLVPLKLGFGVPATLWILAFLTFILLILIDIRLRIIPDKLSILTAILGVLLFAFYGITGQFGLVNGEIRGSFLGSYSLNFWLGEPGVFLNYTVGVLFGISLFGLVYLLSRGQAMGFGDVKLAGAVGSLLGWPDVALALILAFITGAIWGSVLVLRRRKGMKDSLPFGPFIVSGVTLVFFFGYDILNGYFSIFGIY